ncbi:MAG: HIT family protein [Caldilineae bacterium]|nr:HIT family protein [Chloroflexota bacterium]MCB9177583.1 HIT family protein [Caldilineae bacterium]
MSDSSPADCIFCRILAGEAPASFVHRDARVSAFLDIQPVNAGHLLVVPNQHAALVTELDPETAGRMLQVAAGLDAALRASGLRCEAVNLFLADGEEAGQEVFHSHLHVLPRFAGDGFGLRFGPSYGQQPPREELERVAARIRAAGIDLGQGRFADRP